MRKSPYLARNSLTIYYGIDKLAIGGKTRWFRDEKNLGTKTKVLNQKENGQKKTFYWEKKIGEEKV